MNDRTIEQTYSNRSNAAAAARAVLAKDGVENALSMVHFKIEPQGDRFVWRRVFVDTKVADYPKTPQRRAMEAQAATDLVDALSEQAVTVCPAKAAKGVKAPSTREPVRQVSVAELPVARGTKIGAVPSERRAKAVKLGKRAAIAQAVAEGAIPPAPVWSVKIRDKYQPKFDEIAELAEKADVAGLRAMPISADMKQKRLRSVAKYRDQVVAALEARASA